jgi:hypothetical protein
MGSDCPSVSAYCFIYYTVVSFLFSILFSPVHFGAVTLSPLLSRESLNLVTGSFSAYFRPSSFTSDGDLIWCFLRLVDLLTELRFLRA